MRTTEFPPLITVMKSSIQGRGGEEASYVCPSKYLSRVLVVSSCRPSRRLSMASVKHVNLSLKKHHLHGYLATIAKHILRIP